MKKTVKIFIVGDTGSGKTTLAEEITALLDSLKICHSLYDDHDPNYVDHDDRIDSIRKKTEVEVITMQTQPRRS